MSLGPNSDKHNTEFVPAHRRASLLGGSTDPDEYMRGRLLSQGVFERAALFDKDDFLCVAATNRNTGDPTTVNVPDSPPSSVKLEDQEFQYLGATPDNMHAQGPNGSYLFLGQTATMFLIAQTPAGVNREAAQIIMNEFQRSLVDMPLGQGL